LSDKSVALSAMICNPGPSAVPAGGTWAIANALVGVTSSEAVKSGRKSGTAAKPLRPVMTVLPSGQITFGGVRSRPTGMRRSWPVDISTWMFVSKLS
jgi:hypothetical protein